MNRTPKMLVQNHLGGYLTHIKVGTDRFNTSSEDGRTFTVEDTTQLPIQSLDTLDIYIDSVLYTPNYNTTKVVSHNVYRANWTTTDNKTFTVSPLSNIPIKDTPFSAYTITDSASYPDVELTEEDADNKIFQLPLDGGILHAPWKNGSVTIKDSSGELGALAVVNAANYTVDLRLGRVQFNSNITIVKPVKATFIWEQHTEQTVGTNTITVRDISLLNQGKITFTYSGAVPANMTAATLFFDYVWDETVARDPDVITLDTGTVKFGETYDTEIVQLNYTWLEAQKTTLYTSPVSTRTQVTQMWVTNTNKSLTRNIRFYAHGASDTNILMEKLVVPPEETIIIDDMKIVLAAEETLSAIQDSNTDDVNITIYGVTEA